VLSSTLAVLGVQVGTRPVKDERCMVGSRAMPTVNDRGHLLWGLATPRAYLGAVAPASGTTATLLIFHSCMPRRSTTR
jgi:hypothetical protein